MPDVGHFTESLTLPPPLPANEASISERQVYRTLVYEPSQCFGNQAFPSITQANIVWPDLGGSPDNFGDYQAYKIMNSVIRATWIGHPDRVADLVNPWTCDVHLLTDFNQTGVPMPWYWGAAKIAEKDFRSHGEGSLERAWKLVTNSSVDYIALDKCTETDIQQVAAVLVQAPNRVSS